MLSSHDGVLEANATCSPLSGPAHMARYAAGELRPVMPNAAIHEGPTMPAKTERYRFAPWEIEDINGMPRKLPGGYANVTRGGGMKYDQVVFLGPDNTIREEFHLKRGHVRKLEQFGFASRVAETGSE
jgi:hypothetical protein